jgi:hypothetical protein
MAKEITIVLPPLSDEDRARLRRSLHCDSDDELDSVLAKCAQAGLTELTELFIGRKVFTRGSDFREYRLRLLLEELADSVDLFDEGNVSNLFQTTSTQSRTLIRSTLAKYQFDLESAVEKTALTALGNAWEKSSGESTMLFRASRNVTEELRNRLLRLSREDNEDYGAITPAESSGWTYEVGKTALARLKEDLESQPSAS